LPEIDPSAPIPPVAPEDDAGNADADAPEADTGDAEASEGDETAAAAVAPTGGDADA
jgi:hypothetical protein